MILCDIGNTSVDLFEGGKSIKYRLDEFDPIGYSETVYYISVNQAFTERLKILPQWINIESWIDRSGYYPTMGIDRIIVCEAVEEGTVVDAGSAVTVDIMKKGVYQGGYIALGIRSAQEAYARLSSVLGISFNFEVDLTIMAKNTPDAITLGYFSPLIHSIRALNTPLYLTGGDARVFAHWLDEAIVDEQLIFKGMKKIIEKGNGC